MQDHIRVHGQLRRRPFFFADLYGLIQHHGVGSQDPVSVQDDIVKGQGLIVGKHVARGKACLTTDDGGGSGVALIIIVVTGGDRDALARRDGQLVGGGHVVIRDEHFDGIGFRRLTQRFIQGIALLICACELADILGLVEQHQPVTGGYFSVICSVGAV